MAYLQNCTNILHDFLANKKQRVVLNGQVHSWANINAGVPQGSTLTPLFFLPISMTYQMVSHQKLNCLLLAHRC